MRALLTPLCATACGRQDSGLWRHAATLAAAQLSGSELSAILERWAVQVLAVEGGVWRAVGLLTAGGCCHATLR
jgi:hypothetical protein